MTRARKRNSCRESGVKYAERLPTPLEFYATTCENLLERVFNIIKLELNLAITYMKHFT